MNKHNFKGNNLRCSNCGATTEESIKYECINPMNKENEVSVCCGAFGELKPTGCPDNTIGCAVYHCKNVCSKCGRPFVAVKPLTTVNSSKEEVNKPNKENNCDCKEKTCPKGCTRNHTCKGFFCEKCEPERCAKMYPHIYPHKEDLMNEEEVPCYECDRGTCNRHNLDELVAKEVPREDWEESEREAWKNFCNTDNFSAPPYEHNTITGYWFSRMQKRIDEARKEGMNTWLKFQDLYQEGLKAARLEERTKLRTMIEGMKKDYSEAQMLELENLPMNEKNIKELIKIACNGRQNAVIQDIINSLQETDE